MTLGVPAMLDFLSSKQDRVGFSAQHTGVHAASVLVQHRPAYARPLTIMSAGPTPTASSSQSCYAVGQDWIQSIEAVNSLVHLFTGVYTCMELSPTHSLCRHALRGHFLDIPTMVGQ